MNNQCKNLLKKDVDSHTKEQYEQMEKELEDKINHLINETENKYCVQPMIKLKDSETRVSVFIMNKAIHNNPPFSKI
jgi:hypothetical protein